MGQRPAGNPRHDYERGEEVKPFTLRPYQAEAVKCVIEKWYNHRSTMVVLPTGGGKTIVFASVIAKMKQRAIVLSHVKELVHQARLKIIDTTGLIVDVEMGEIHAQIDGNLFTGHKAPDVIVSTPQTQNSGMGGAGRKTKFDPMNFGVLIIDECDVSASERYRELIKYYTDGNPDLRVLGVTATPDRTDELALGEIFETVAFNYQILDAIQDGWLVPIEQRLICVGSLDFSNVRTTCGDLNGADLARVMEAEGPVQEMVQATFEAMFRLPENSLADVPTDQWATLVKGRTPRRTLVFTASVKHAEMFSAIFNRIIPDIANWVCGKTPPEEREDTNLAFARGEIALLANCGTHTVGYDNPAIEMIVMGRPTKSRRLYCQCAGRGTRPLPGVVDGPETPEARRAAIEMSAKPSVLVLDFVGNSGRHKLMTTADMLGGKISDAVKARALELAKQKPVMMSKALDEAEEELKREQAEAVRREEAARKAKIVAKAKYQSRKVDPFDIVGVTAIAPRHNSYAGTLTDSQREMLKRNGFEPDTLDVSQARNIIGAINERRKQGKCTIKQAVTLKKNGFNPEMSFEAAHAQIDAIVASGWKLKGPLFK